MLHLHTKCIMSLVPGIDLRLLTLEMNFYVPFLREFLLMMGMCNASKRACNTILQRGRGSAIMLVVGGAAESLESAPGESLKCLRAVHQSAS